ncbi:GPI transamidase component PIG-S-like [Scylla paramamosain]|uniref:GPI transamidase component PIG-S-like n=1 Tax=Scylla paramamosain TaxID=85552 RepID=UPI0030835C4C
MSKEEDNAKNPEGAWAAAGFAVVLLVVGVPVWWFTTTVYRAQLPYSTIETLSSQLRHHTVGVTIIGSLPPSFQEDLVKSLGSMQSVKFLMSQRQPTKEERQALHSGKTPDELDRHMSQLVRVAAGMLAVVVLPEAMEIKEVVVGTDRLIYIKATADLQVVSSVVRNMVMDPLASRYAFTNRPLHHKKEAMRQVPTEPGYDVTLTLMVPEPHRTKIEWDARAAVTDYLSPVVKQLENVSKLTVRSQVLYMTGLSVSPQWSEAHKHYALPENQLPLTINAIEAKLGSFVWTRPSLHFVVYIPREKQLPLHIHAADGSPLPSNSFLVPRWGGVMIHNVPTAAPNVSLPRPVTLDSHWIMSTVLTHLHRLLPIPSLREIEGVETLAMKDSSMLTAWQLDGLARARVSAYLSNIRITLQSLCELVGEISNMVISDEVGGWVWGAVEEWEECGRATREGRLQDATLYCTRSFTQADAAFFHPSMLALLYFPDNQKYAIYVPLFLPVSIPVLLSLKMVFGLCRKSSTKEKNE